eukprot:UN16026
MKREMETKISELTRTLKKTLADVQGREIVSTKEEDLYYQLQDTFNAFDRDGSAELGFPEYMEAWKFIGQPGTDADIKKAFDGVDIDRSGLLTWTEFVFSIMGKKAQNYGVLADMESLQDLLKETVTELSLLKEALNESREGT